MDIGREIRRAREAKGWSQAKLAGASDMGVSGISQIETGTRNPSVTTLSKIAEALEVEVRDLFPLAQPPLDFDAADLETVEKADAQIRQWRPEAKRAIARGGVFGWTEPQEAEQRRQIFDHLKDVSEQRQKLASPLATITERDGKAVEIIYHREPTPEERDRLRVEYPDAVEVEDRETVLVW